MESSCAELIILSEFCHRTLQSCTCWATTRKCSTPTQRFQVFPLDPCCSHFSQSQLRSDQEISKNHKRKVSALHGGAFGRARSGPDTFVADDLVLSPEEREKRMALALQATSMLGMPGESEEATEETLGCEKKRRQGDVDTERIRKILWDGCGVLGYVD